VHPPDTRTGIEEVDAIIDAIVAGGIDARRELVQYTTTGCTTALGLGGPPKCESGEAEGTLVEVFPFLRAEGEYVRRESIDRVLRFAVEGLYAVYRVPDDAYEEEYWPAGEYGIVFTREGRANFRALLPRFQDVKDVINNVLWYFGLVRERAGFARFSFD